MNTYRCEKGDVINIAEIKKIFLWTGYSLAFGHQNLFEVHLPGIFWDRKLFVSKNDYDNILTMMGYTREQINETYDD